MGAKGSGLRLPVGDVHQITLTPTAPTTRALAARGVVRRAASPVEARLLLDVLGLDRADVVLARNPQEAGR